MLKNSRPSSHDAVDQRSWDSKVNWRTYDIAIDCGVNCLPRLRYVWFDDCVCIEEDSRQACTLLTKCKCPEDALKRTTDSYEERKLLTWPRSIFAQPDLIMHFMVYQFCSIYAYRMTTFKISTYDRTKLYHCFQNNYSFDALQAYCFRIT